VKRSEAFKAQAKKHGWRQLAAPIRQHVAAPIDAAARNNDADLTVRPLVHVARA
jgi:hypothetical protein